MNVPAADWREEVAVSGACRKRPVLDTILDECEAGAVSHLICADFDRAGRSGFRTCAMVEDLVEDYGVEVVFCREGMRVHSPIPFRDKATMAALSIGGMAKLESGSNATRAAFQVRDGVTVARRSGKRVGRPRWDFTPEEDAELLRLRGEMSFEDIAAKHLLRIRLRSAMGAVKCRRTPSVTALRERAKALAGAGK